MLEIKFTLNETHSIKFAKIRWLMKIVYCNTNKMCYRDFFPEHYSLSKSMPVATMKAYVSLEVQLPSFITLKLERLSGLLHAQALYSAEEILRTH